MLKRIALILTATVIALSSFTFPSRAVAPLIWTIAEVAYWVVGGSAVLWIGSEIAEDITVDNPQYWADQAMYVSDMEQWWKSNYKNLYDTDETGYINFSPKIDIPNYRVGGLSYTEYCYNMMLVMNVVAGNLPYDDGKVMRIISESDGAKMTKEEYEKLKQYALSINLDVWNEKGVTFTHMSETGGTYGGGGRVRSVKATIDKPKTLSLFGLDYEVMNTDKKYSHSYKEEPTIYKIVDGLHNRAYELILVDEDNNIYVQLNQELFNLYSSGFRNYYTKEGSFYGKGYLTNLSRIDQNGNHVYQNLQMIDTAYGHQRVSFYSSQNDNFTYYYFNDITGKFSMYLRSETKEDYVRIEFENLYYNISNSLHEETYYTHDDIKNKKLTPYIIKNVSNSPTVTIAESILLYREVNPNINISDNNEEITIPLTEIEDIIQKAIKNALINDDSIITVKDDSVVKIDDYQIDELKNLLNDIKDDNNENSKEIIGFLEKILQNLINIKDYLTTGYSFTNEDGTTVKTSFWDFLNTIASGILNIVNTVTNGFLNIADTIVGGLLDIVDTLVEKIVDMLIPDEKILIEKVDYFKNEVYKKMPMIEQISTFKTDFIEYLENDSKIIENQFTINEVPQIQNFSFFNDIPLQYNDNIVLYSEEQEKNEFYLFTFNAYGKEFSLIDFSLFVEYREVVHTIIIVIAYIGSAKKIIFKITKLWE